MENCCFSHLESVGDSNPGMGYVRLSWKCCVGFQRFKCSSICRNIENRSADRVPAFLTMPLGAGGCGLV